jgi:hypothetical protein
MDYRSCSASDMHPCDLLRGEFEERGQTATFTHTEDQKWFYLDKQTTSEVTLVKIWDNKPDSSQCKPLLGSLWAGVANVHKFARTWHSIIRIRHRTYRLEKVWRLDALLYMHITELG